MTCGPREADRVPFDDISSHPLLGRVNPINKFFFFFLFPCQIPSPFSSLSRCDLRIHLLLPPLASYLLLQRTAPRRHLVLVSLFFIFSHLPLRRFVITSLIFLRKRRRGEGGNAALGGGVLGSQEQKEGRPNCSILPFPKSTPSFRFASFLPWFIH
uniref:Transmembrane protein n=1 Tax=Oryza nivara TaxID=4536 RepID=A0A0E0IX62_ORYNI